MPELITVILILLAITLLVNAALKSRGRKKTTDPEFPYHEYPYSKISRLFSGAERSFLGVLQQAIGKDYVVMGKIRVADILCVKKGVRGKEFLASFAKIRSKHFDFALCDPKTYEIACVVELQDKSHNDPKRTERDEFLRNACYSAGY